MGLINNSILLISIFILFFYNYYSELILFLFNYLPILSFIIYF